MHPSPAALLLAALLLAGEDPAPPPPALGGLDPVALAAGREVPGLPDLSETHGRHRYLFADAESRARFRADPAAHAVRFDGYCMRMGPLTGFGGPGRFAVHEGRLYLFASDACRTRFLADPASFIDEADPVPAADDAARKRGGELLDLAVKGMGGRAALEAATTVRVRILPGEVAEGETPMTTILTLRFPGILRTEIDWGTGRHASLLLPGAGYDTAGKDPPVGEDVRAWMERDLHRRPLALLRAWMAGDAVASALGKGTLGEVPVERVAVSAAGATTVLTLDPATGRLLETAWKGRTGSGIRPLRSRWSEFRPVGGLLLPHAVATAEEGSEGMPAPLSWEVNPEVPEADLSAPR